MTHADPTICRIRRDARPLWQITARPWVEPNAVRVRLAMWQANTHLPRIGRQRLAGVAAAAIRASSTLCEAYLEVERDAGGPGGAATAVAETRAVAFREVADDQAAPALGAVGVQLARVADASRDVTAGLARLAAGIAGLSR
jgi:hypothetical protein